MAHYTLYVGLDVHKDSIAVATAALGSGEPEYLGMVENTEIGVRKLLKTLAKRARRLDICYEAGPCGYGIYRLIRSKGYQCAVVAPSLIPRKPGDRIKTDRRDAVTLARLHRSGDLTAISVPDEEHEAVRDLTRAREDAKAVQRFGRQRLAAFLLRHDARYTGRTRWNAAHFEWLEQLKFPLPTTQIVFQECVDVIKEADIRAKGLEQQIEQAVAGWSREPVVRALMALRGVDLIAATTLVAEIGDVTRFSSPRQLMSYMGLVPSEYSSGAAQRRGAITKAGNSHARRILIEAAWAYRFPARKTAVIQQRAKKTSLAVQQIAWKAQKRLCGRFRHLFVTRNKPSTVTCTAVARELVAFVWAIAREVAEAEFKIESIADSMVRSS